MWVRAARSGYDHMVMADFPCYLRKVHRKTLNEMAVFCRETPGTKMFRSRICHSKGIARAKAPK